MKKLSLLVVVLLIGLNVYGARGYWEDNSNLPATWTNGYVGIGTEYPYYLLDVDGTIRMKGFRLSTGVHSGYVLTCGSGGVGTWQPAPGGGTCLWSSNGSKIYYNSGYVGIGTSSPSAKLGIANLGSSNNVPILVMSENANDEFIFKGDFAGTGETGNLLKLETMWGNNAMTWRGDGNVGIGTTTPFGPLSVKTASNHNLVVENFSTGVRIAVSQDNGTGNEELVLSGGLGEDHVIVDRNGNVGIGTADPGDYKLAVDGHIRTKEITVESDWSDFVFEDDYRLMPLEKLGKHIKEEKSLPGIPTEKEVKENGVEVGEMQAKLLEKVEELTLYVIELKKENETLKKRIDALGN